VQSLYGGENQYSNSLQNTTSNLGDSTSTPLQPQYVIDLNVRAEGTNIIGRTNFYILQKTNLTDSAWATNSCHTVTGDVTRVSITNFSPSAYFKVTDGK
jgi:hypothetical protein